MKDHKINENAFKKCTRLHNAEKWSNSKYLALQHFYVIKFAFWKIDGKLASLYQKNLQKLAKNELKMS